MRARQRAEDLLATLRKEKAAEEVQARQRAEAMLASLRKPGLRVVNLQDLGPLKPISRGNYGVLSSK